MRECFCFGSEAVNANSEAVRGLVKSPVEFPPAQIGHYRNVRGLGKSKVFFRFFEKLRYSNERSTIF